MRNFEIPPKSNAYLFSMVRSVSPYLVDYKIVFAPSLQSAVNFINRFNLDQGLDVSFHYVSEVSLADVHVSSQSVTQCVLDL